MDSELVREFMDEARERMARSVEATRTEFATVRTGRASPQLLDRVDVDYYGAVTPLKQLASNDQAQSQGGLTPDAEKQIEADLAMVEAAVDMGALDVEKRFRPDGVAEGAQDRHGDRGGFTDLALQHRLVVTVQAQDHAGRPSIG